MTLVRKVFGITTPDSFLHALLTQGADHVEDIFHDTDWSIFDIRLLVDTDEAHGTVTYPLLTGLTDFAHALCRLHAYAITGVPDTAVIPLDEEALSVDLSAWSSEWHFQLVASLKTALDRVTTLSEQARWTLIAMIVLPLATYQYADLFATLTTLPSERWRAELQGNHGWGQTHNDTFRKAMTLLAEHLPEGYRPLPNVVVSIAMEALLDLVRHLPEVRTIAINGATVPAALRQTQQRPTTGQTPSITQTMTHGLYQLTSIYYGLPEGWSITAKDVQGQSITAVLSADLAKYVDAIAQHYFAKEVWLDLTLRTTERGGYRLTTVLDMKGAAAPAALPTTADRQARKRSDALAA